MYVDFEAVSPFVEIYSMDIHANVQNDTRANFFFLFLQCHLQQQEIIKKKKQHIHQMSGSTYNGIPHS